MNLSCKNAAVYSMIPPVRSLLKWMRQAFLLKSSPSILDKQYLLIFEKA
ncbi:MAG: hypothetical protein OEV42_07375 [Deltaproteobacteria bacterium]|nr:hypothetical protein [Deltaproteobacteria bacterium]